MAELLGAVVPLIESRVPVRRVVKALDAAKVASVPSLYQLARCS